MATRHPGDRAGNLACNLYSTLLNRDPDPEGYVYVRKSLLEGTKSVRQHVLEIVGSEEFSRKFVRNRPRQSVVQHLHTVMLGRTISDPYRLARQAAEFALLDLVPYADQLTRSPDYQRMYGEDRVPATAQAGQLN